jgi:NAD(P)H-binding
MRVCIVGASGKLGMYMVEHALERGYDVVGVCRDQSVGKLDAYRGRMEIVPGATNDPEVLSRAAARCDGVLVVLAPWGMNHYASGTAQAFWTTRLRARDSCSRAAGGLLGTVRTCTRGRSRPRSSSWGDLPGLPASSISTTRSNTRRVFASDTRWTVVRGSDLEDGPSEGLPVWSRHVGDPILKSNRTRRVDFALFMVDALTNDDLIHQAPAIVGRHTRSAMAHATTARDASSATPAGAR